MLLDAEAVKGPALEVREDRASAARFLGLSDPFLRGRLRDSAGRRQDEDGDQSHQGEWDQSGVLDGTWLSIASEGSSVGVDSVYGAEGEKVRFAPTSPRRPKTFSSTSRDRRPDPPPPGGCSPGGKVVVVAAGEGLERDQRGVVLEQDRGAGGGVDVGLGRAADDVAPTRSLAGRASRSPRPSRGLATILDRGEGGGAPARGGQVGAGGDRAALPAAAAEVDRDQRQAVGPGLGDRRRREGADQARQRPAVGGDQRVVAAGVGKAGAQTIFRPRARARVRPASTSPPEATAAIAATRSRASSAARPTCSTLAEPISLLAGPRRRLLSRSMSRS